MRNASDSMKAMTTPMPRRLYRSVRSRAGRWLRCRDVRRVQDYLRVRDRSALALNYIGWVGYSNIGDEALYEAFRDVLFPGSLMILDDDFSLLSWAARQSRRPMPTLLGGGTLINLTPYFTALSRARASGAPYAVFGTGVADLDYWSRHPEVTGRDGAEDWASLLRDAEYVGVRGPRSARYLAAQGVKGVEIIGDPALALPRLMAPPSDGDFVVGLNLGSHDPVDGGADPLFDATVALARHALHAGMRIDFIPLHPIDARAGKRLFDALDRPARLRLLPADTDVARVRARLAACDVVVGQRLHATVLASALGIANLSLSYQPKCLDFLDSIDQSELAIDTANITSGALIDRFEWLIDHRHVLASNIDTACDAFRRKQIERAGEIRSLLTRHVGDER